jgi:multiple sugar transport system substrate-binding protein
MEAAVKYFNDTHPNIQIKMDIMPWDTLYQKLLPSLKSGGEPDIVAVGDTNLPQYADSGLLQPLDDLWSSGLDPKKFSAGALQGMTYKGQKYGAPIIYFGLLLYYNKDLFTAAGLDPNKCPANWDEWQADILKLTKDANGDGKPEQYGIAWGDHAAPNIWPALVWQGGGDFISQDGTKSMLNDPKTIAAIKTWTDLIRGKHIMPLGLSGVEADNLVGSGKAAMEVSGPWMVGGFKAAGINFDACQLPAGPAGQANQGSGVYMVVNKNSKNKQAAYEFLKFWEDDWAQVHWSSSTGFPPARTDMANNPDIQKNPFVQKFAQAGTYVRAYLPGLTQYSKIDADIITPAILSVARGEQTADAALNDAATKMNTVLAAGK